MKTSKLLGAIGITGVVAHEFPDCVNGPVSTQFHQTSFCDVLPLTNDELVGQ